MQSQFPMRVIIMTYVQSAPMSLVHFLMLHITFGSYKETTVIIL